MPETKKRRVGRPPMDKSLKAHEYKVSMTSVQMEEIDQAAAEAGMGRSEYFRFLHKTYQKKSGG